MLSPDDADLVRRDPSIPGLDVLLDNDALASFAAESLLVPNVVEACSEYVRYKPRQNCLARFRVFSSERVHDFYAIAYRPVDQAKLSKARGATVIPGRCMVVCPFPIDLELTSLATFSSDAELRRLLVRMGRAEMAAGPVVHTSLRYKPERRYVGRIESPVGAATLKLYSPDIFRAACLTAKALGSAVSPPIVRRVAHWRRHRAILFGWQPGVTLSSQLECGMLPVPVIRQVGEQLSRLHSSTAIRLRFYLPQEDAKSLIAVAGDLAPIVPGLATQAQRLANQVAERVAATRPSQLACIHGDFSAEQIVVENGQPFFIDLDRASHSVSAKDIGNFCAHLEVDTLRGQCSDQQRDQAAAALVDGYCAAGRSVDLREVDLYTAAGLLRLAHEPFRNRRSDWHELVARIVLRAQEIAARLQQPVPHRTRGTIEPDLALADGIVDVPDDIQMPFLKQALAPQNAKQRLADVLSNDKQLRSFELSSIRLLRYKRGRRCLIEYRGRLAVSGSYSTVLGKIHAKGRYEQALLRQQSLWDAGFDYDCSDGICVARPLGIIPEWHMWLQCAAPGQVSWRALAGPRALQIATRIAEAAQKLHQANIPTKQTHTLNDELAHLSERLLRVAHELPEFCQRIRRILDQCYELAETIIPVSPVGIHRDFYPDQVLIDGDRLFVVDHDLYALGDSRLDIGNFCGHLIERSIRIEQRPHMYDCPAATMIDRFVELHGGDQRCRHAINVYTVLTVARHVFLSGQIPERMATTVPLIELLERLTSRGPAADIRMTFSNHIPGRFEGIRGSLVE